MNSNRLYILICSTNTWTHTVFSSEKVWMDCCSYRFVSRISSIRFRSLFYDEYTESFLCASHEFASLSWNLDIHCLIVLALDCTEPCSTLQTGFIPYRRCCFYLVIECLFAHFFVSILNLIHSHVGRVNWNLMPLWIMNLKWRLLLSSKHPCFRQHYY